MVDTAVVGSIYVNDESVCRKKVEEHPVGWCRESNICIIVKKTEYIAGTVVEVISSFRDDVT